MKLNFVDVEIAAWLGSYIPALKVVDVGFKISNNIENKYLKIGVIMGTIGTATYTYLKANYLIRGTLTMLADKLEKYEY